MITDKDVEKLKGTFTTKEDLKQFATKKELQNFKDEVNQKFDEVNQKFDEVNQKFDETNRHFDVVAEDIINSNKLVLEQFSTNTGKLADHEEKIEILTTDVSILKSKITAAETKIGK